MKNIKFPIKIISLTIMVFITLIIFSGCGEKSTKVENLMKINNDGFVGERVIKVDFGSDFAENESKKKNLEEVIKNNCPPIMSCRSEISDGSYKCTFVLSFSSLDDYRMKIASIVGKQISVAYGYTDTALSKGTYYQEDYDGLKLVEWLENALSESGYSDFMTNIKSSSNVVKYNKEVLSSETSVMNTSTIKGEPVHEITIDTTNYKNGNYNRTLTISVPKDTYNKMGESINNIMQSRIGQGAVSSGWADNGEYINFSVTYENINLEQLEENTKLFLDCENGSLYYGDQNHSSTPLAEQLVFEEKINVLNMISDTEDNVQLKYNYTLPEETTHGEGVQLINGEWESKGNWLKNTYKVTDTQGVYDIRIPDGMQYTVKGINIKLTSLEEDKFRREVEFIFDRNTGEKGLNYAYNFLYNMGINVSKENTFEGSICRITHEGTVSDINSAVSDVFGSGNYFEYIKRTNELSVVTEINATDHINIAHMLTGSNTNISINYIIQSESSQYIKNMRVTDNANNLSAKIKVNKDKSRTSTIDSGNFSVSYSATVPYEDGILLYSIISTSVVVIFMLTILFLNKYNKRKLRKESEKKRKSHKRSSDIDEDEFILEEI